MQQPVKAKNNFASYGTVLGIIKDAETAESLLLATVIVVNPGDSSVVASGTTDDKGSFKIESIPFGNYYLKISFIGYETYKTPVFSLSESQQQKDIGLIKLKSSTSLLKGVTVEAKQEAVQQKGDTIQYNANSFKTNPDANAEDLITKMPGVSSENGKVKVHGEEIKQVLVDGKPFFGDDPNAALKNLPAEMIDKIQVFDKASDQAQFTGFDDGQSNKTINITTKAGKNNGQFGKLYAGYGNHDHYIAGGNINLFKGNRRISLIGLSNNINQQNFTTQDLLGVTGSTGQGGMGPGNAGGRSSSGQRSGNGSYGGPDLSNFLTNQQEGISTTDAIGLNYSDNWGKKIKTSGSYFFNRANNNNNTFLTRDYITGQDSSFYYNEQGKSGNSNYNHRFNFKLEYTIDSLNSLILTPKLNLQQNQANSIIAGNSLLVQENSIESKIENNNNSKNAGYNFSNDLLYRHKFKKRGRTFSLNIGTEINNKNGNGNLYSLNKYYYLNDSSLINQQFDQYVDGYTISSNIGFTEPIDSSSQLLFSYIPSYTNNKTDKETNNLNIADQEYSQLDTLLSNKFNNTYFSNRAGASYRLNKKTYNLMAGLNFQYATLSGNQYFPVAFVSEKYFSSILPQVTFNYKFSKGTNVRIIYRTSTNTPSISQLQNVVNNNNPILLSTGNPDLKQNYGHTIIINYGKTKAEKATGLFIFLYGNYTQNYIGKSTFIPVKDTILDNDIVVKRGSQLTKPVNLQGYQNARTFITYALPISKIKCNLNFSAGFNYSQTPALVNDITNLANNYSFNPGIGISSNISEKLDFNLSYTTNYNIITNSLQKQLNNNYLYHSSSFKFNWIGWKGLSINTNINYTLYTGLSQSFNQNYLLWNASLAYKLLKDKSLEIKASVFDILNQNNSITRTVSETYIEDRATNVLNRYFMLMLTYNLRSFIK